MQLIWFRQDLRIHDHAALWQAHQAGDPSQNNGQHVPLKIT